MVELVARLVSVAKLGNALQVLIPVPKGRRIVAQGSAAEPWEKGRNDASPGWGGGKPIGLRNSGKHSVTLCRALRTQVFSDPGFRFTSPRAIVSPAFQGLRPLAAGALTFRDKSYKWPHKPTTLRQDEMLPCSVETRSRRGCYGQRPWLGWCVPRAFQPPHAGFRHAKASQAFTPPYPRRGTFSLALALS